MLADEQKLKELKILQIKNIIFIAFFVLVVGGAIFTIKNSFVKPDEQEEELFDYSIKDTIQYKVHLYENSFYEEPYLGMDRQYAADLIKSIEVDFFSNLKTSKPATVYYTYSVNAQINGTYSSDSSRLNNDLWNKPFPLVSKTDATMNDHEANMLKETVNIDFAYYNQLVADFKKELRLNIDATFNVEMNIDYKITVGTEVVTKNEVLKLSLPLTKVAFVISTTTPEPVSETIYNYGDLVVNYFSLIPAIIFLIIAIILFINFIRKILKLNQKTEYQIRLNKILKNFGEVIAKSETAPNFAKYDILDITHFEDLVDIENEVRIPIIYYEKEKDYEGWFTLVHGNQMYRYILYNNEKDQKLYEHTMQLKINK